LTVTFIFSTLPESLPVSHEHRNLTGRFKVLSSARLATCSFSPGEVLADGHRMQAAEIRDHVGECETHFQYSVPLSG
jgi:hypothetical protein